MSFNKDQPGSKIKPNILKELDVEYQQFNQGQKVRNQFGEIRTVLRQIGYQVFVEEECNGHYHPSKLFSIEESTTFKSS